MIDCLFVLRDFGETTALVPVAERLIEDNYSVNVLALGQAARNKLASINNKRFRYTIIDDVPGVSTRLGEASSDFGGAAALQAGFAAPDDAAKAAAHLTAHVTVSGVVGRSQQQFLAAAKAAAAEAGRGAPAPQICSIGYYSSLAINLNCALLQANGSARGPNQCDSFLPVLDSLWVPMQGLIQHIVDHTGIQRSMVRAVGQPEVDAFVSSLPTLAGRAASVRQRLHLPADEKLVFFASGRDEPGKTVFRSAFRAMLSGMVEAKALGTPVRLIVGIHPACTGLTERDWVRELNLSDWVQVMATKAQPDSLEEFSTNELMLAADKVLTWNSTSASLLALSPAGADKVLFVSAEGPPEIFAAVEAGLAKQATSPAQVATFLAAANTSQASRPTAIMPPDGTTTMVDLIKKALKEAIVSEGRSSSSGR